MSVAAGTVAGMILGRPGTGMRLSLRSGGFDGIAQEFPMASRTFDAARVPFF